METILYTYAVPCLCAFLACLGFTLIFNIHGMGKLVCCIGGALAWLVYLLAGSTIFGAFLAAASIGIYAEIMSRVRRCPVSSYVLIALLPWSPEAAFITQWATALPERHSNFLARFCIPSAWRLPWLSGLCCLLRFSGRFSRICTSQKSNNRACPLLERFSR